MRRLGKLQRALYHNLSQAGPLLKENLIRRELNALTGLISSGFAREAEDKIDIVPPWDLNAEQVECLRVEADLSLIEDLTQRRPHRRQKRIRPGASPDGSTRPILSLSVTVPAHDLLIGLGPDRVRELLSEVVRIGFAKAEIASREFARPAAAAIAGDKRKVYGVAIPHEWAGALKGKTQTGLTRDLVVRALECGWGMAINGLNG